MPTKKNTEPSRRENARPVPAPPLVKDPSPGRVPDDVPRWSPDYSRYTGKKK